MNNIFYKPTMRILLAMIFCLQSMTLFAQTAIKGTVVAAMDGEALPGAYVIEKGTNNGMVVSFDGSYALTVADPANATLVFSFMGFVDQEIKVGNQTVINVKLKEDVTALDEVVINGYATESKKMATGNYTTIDSKDLSEKISASFQEGLQGLAPSLDVQGASGAVGGSVNIRIRGTGSLSSNSNPLYVIDGIPFTSYPTDGTGNFGTSFNPMTNINPEDIESMTVLKDAEATAIYGSRGANGVILIKTKSGAKGKAQWDLSYTEGISRPTNMLPHVGTQDWLTYTEDGWNNAGTPEADRRLPYTTTADKGWYTEDVARTIDQDKYRETYRQGRNRNVSLAVSGGNDRLTYRVNGTYNYTEGIMYQNDNERIAFSSNMNVKLNDKMNLGISANISSVDNGQYPTNIYFLNLEGRGGTIFQYWSNPTGINFIKNALPMYPTYNDDGTFFQGTSLVNTAPTRDPEYFSHESKNFTAINSANYNYQINENLRLDANLGVTNTTYERDVWFSPFITTVATAPGAGPEDYGYADGMKQARTYINTNAILNYGKTWGKHSFDGLLGFESFTERQRFQSMKGVGFPQTNSIKNVGSAASILEWRSGSNGVVFYSGFFRAKYAYDQKYIFGLSVRSDGSSRFGSKNRWGTFPSASVGWNISEEAFLKDSRVVNYLKLRGSYGVSGNAEIDQSAAFANWRFVSQSYGGSQGIEPIRLKESTDNIGWERAYSMDLGLDYELFGGVLKGELAYFQRTNDDLLAKLSLPLSAGGGQYIANSGTIKNWGYEFSMTAQVIDRAVQWSTTLHASLLRNEVIALGADPSVFEQRGGTALPVIGGSVASYQMVKWLGVDPETGYELFEDPKTGKPYEFVDPARPSKAEMESLVQRIDDKSGLPQFTGGWSNNISYKGISLSFMFSFRQGNWLYDDELHTMAYMKEGNQLTNVPQMFFDERWQQPGDQTDVPAPMYNHPFGQGNPDRGSRSTRFLYDGSFIRLRNLTVAYTLPKSMTSKVGLNNVRVFATGNNLLTFTKYPGWDPESANSIGNFSPTEANIAPGVISGNPPQAMMVKLGVNLKF
ncbi:SusC/RagA family TonB-linked outer membrane protein [Persicobacter psychrovividus]